MTGSVLSYERFEPAQERLCEALCTLGNSYFATRGAAPECSADDVLRLDPCLPEMMRGLTSRIRYRGQSLELDVTQQQLRIGALHGTAEAVRIGFAGKIYLLAAGERQTFVLDRAPAAADQLHSCG